LKIKKKYKYIKRTIDGVKIDFAQESGTFYESQTRGNADYPNLFRIGNPEA